MSDSLTVPFIGARYYQPSLDALFYHRGKSVPGFVPSLSRFYKQPSHAGFPVLKDAVQAPPHRLPPAGPCTRPQRDRSLLGADMSRLPSPSQELVFFFKFGGFFGGWTENPISS